MALTPKQPSGQRLYDDLLRRVRALETRRVLPNASIGTGGIYVKAENNAAAGSIHLWVETQQGTSAHDATLDFQPSESTVYPARIRMQDDGAGLPASYYGLGISSACAVAGRDDASKISLGAGGMTLRTSQNANAVSLEMRDGFPAILRGWTFDSTTVDSPTNSLRWQAASGEWQAKNTSGAFVAIRASSFPTSSSKAAKQNIDAKLPFDPAAVITNAPVYGWQYREEMAQDTARHYFPMADDLPAELVTGSGQQMSVDTRDLLGVNWAVTRTLLARNTALEERLTKLEQQNQTLAVKLGIKL